MNNCFKIYFVANDETATEFLDYVEELAEDFGLQCVEIHVDDSAPEVDWNVEVNNALGGNSL